MIEFGKIIGQDTAIRRIRDAVASRRMPHAFIFTGPEGVGRKSTAEALAAAILCCGKPPGRDGEAGSSLFVKPANAPPTTAEPAENARFEACGRCEDCRMMSAGTHPDFAIVRKELARYHDDQRVRDSKMQELGISVIRQFLIQPAGRIPSRGRAKVFVVLEADLLSVAAQNALLKTLEEPPAGTTIIMICRHVEDLLPTTISRCAVVRFGLLPRDFVARSLMEKDVAVDEARFWAAFTGGSLGRAAELARRGLYTVKKRVLELVAGMATGQAGEASAELNEIMESLAAGVESEVREAEGAELAKTVASRTASGAMLEIIASAFRDAMLSSGGAPAADAVVNADQPRIVELLSGRFSPSQLAEVINQLSRYEQLLWGNVNYRVIWDNVAITCGHGSPLLI